MRSRTSSTRYLRDCGLTVDEDDAGPRVGSTMGNLYARLEPTAEGEPLFLCAHLDTVPPTAAIEPVVEDGIVRNAAGTILGADNKAAVAAMLEATRRVLAENRPHAGHRAALHAEGGGRADRRVRVRPHAAARAHGLRLRPGGADRHGDPRCAVLAGDRGDVPRPRGARRDVSRGRPLGDRGRGARDLGDAARPRRRGVDRERRDDHRRHRREHRPGVVHVRGGGALARRAAARRPDPGDAGRDHVRGRRRRVRGRDDVAQELPRLPVREDGRAVVLAAERSGGAASR